MASSNNSGISVACSCKGAGHWAYWARTAKLSEVEILLSGEEIYLHLAFHLYIDLYFRVLRHSHSIEPLPFTEVVHADITLRATQYRNRSCQRCKIKASEHTFSSQPGYVGR